MTNKDALGRLFAFTEWANHRVVRAAATLLPDDFRRELAGGHGGVRGTLVHMLSSELRWLERFKGLEPTRPLDEGEFADVLALRERWRIVEDHRRDWFSNLDEDGVAKMIDYRDDRGATERAPLWQLVQHHSHHQAQHRGQVLQHLRRLGARPPRVDMSLWDRSGHEEVEA